MALSKDIMGIGVAAEEAIRVGDTGPKYISTFGGSSQSVATSIGAANAETLLELSFSSASVSSVVFATTTEIDRPYTLVNTATVPGNVFPPVGGSFNGLSANASFSLTANKVAYVTRVGPVPSPSGSIASDRWLYSLSN